MCAVNLYRPLRLLLLLVLVPLGACASIVEGTDQSVTVMTDPSGASCSFEREGAVIFVVNPTPGTAQLSKSKHNVSIVCEKEGYQTAAAPLASEFQGMTFGNVIFGGVIGVAVDASTGAMHEYPESVSLILIPNSFATVEERDALFARLKAEIVAESERKTAEVVEACEKYSRADDPEEFCKQARVEMAAKRDAELAELEQKRLAAKVGL